MNKKTNKTFLYRCQGNKLLNHYYIFTEVNKYVIEYVTN